MDTIIKLGRHSLLQHGQANDRVYLMHVGCSDTEAVLERAERLTSEHGYSKIFGKLLDQQVEPFAQAGYVVEATIPRAASQGGPIHFVSRFVTSSRGENRQREETAANLKLARALAARPLAPLPPSATLREATPADCPSMASLYRRVFPSYPFPINDPEYLQKVMASHVRFFLVESDGQLLAASSAEQDVAWGLVEMTDFATAPGSRGRGLAGHLLNAMERALEGNSITTAYTIARSLSPGMNITFSRAGYQLAGTLVNNTQISGSIQNMNVWHKPLP